MSRCLVALLVSVTGVVYACDYDKRYWVSEGFLEDKFEEVKNSQAHSGDDQEVHWVSEEPGLVGEKFEEAGDQEAHFPILKRCGYSAQGAESWNGRGQDPASSFLGVVCAIASGNPNQQGRFSNSSLTHSFNSPVTSLQSGSKLPAGFTICSVENRCNELITFHCPGNQPTLINQGDSEDLGIKISTQGLENRTIFATAPLDFLFFFVKENGELCVTKVSKQNGDRKEFSLLKPQQDLERAVDLKIEEKKVRVVCAGESDYDLQETDDNRKVAKSDESRSFSPLRFALSFIFRCG